MNIKGKVINNCTGEGVPGIKVYLTSEKEKMFRKTETTDISTTSDIDGNFIFTNVEINNKDKYNYSLSINNINTADLYMEGVSGEIDKENISSEYIMGVYPTMKRLSIFLPTSPSINYPVDSFVITLEQKDVLKYLPFKNTKYVLPMYLWYSEYLGTWDDQRGLNGGPMGKWYITTEQYKGGSYNVVYDSVYVGWGASVDYIIPW